MLVLGSPVGNALVERLELGVAFGAPWQAARHRFGNARSTGTTARRWLMPMRRRRCDLPAQSKMGSLRRVGGASVTAIKLAIFFGSYS